MELMFSIFTVNIDLEISNAYFVGIRVQVVNN